MEESGDMERKLLV